MNAPNHSYERPESQAPATPQEQQRARLLQMRVALDKMLRESEERGTPVNEEALLLSVFPTLKFPQPPAPPAEETPAGPKKISRSDQEAINANLEKIARGEIVVE